MTTQRVTLTRNVLIGVAVAIMIFGAVQVSATVVQADPSIDSFWGKFKAAVIKVDKESNATMSQFPITMPYGIPSVRRKVELLKRYREVFSDQTNAAKCFAESKPEVDPADKNHFTVACKDAGGSEVVMYGFVRSRGVWKLRFLDNIAE